MSALLSQNTNIDNEIQIKRQWNINILHVIIEFHTQFNSAYYVLKAKFVSNINFIDMWYVTGDMIVKNIVMTDEPCIMSSHILFISVKLFIK